MNKREDERFCELAHKAIAKEAAAPELAELTTMLEGDPELRREYEQLKADAELLREVLPLVEDVQHPQAVTPRIPIERLQREVRGVFAQGGEAKGRLGTLLGEMRRLFAGERSPEERAQGMRIIRDLEEAFYRVSWKGQLRPDTLMEERSVAFIAESPPTRRTVERSQSRGKVTEGEARRREQEISERLKGMEARLGEAIQRLASCGDEARALLAKIREERAQIERRLAERAPED